MATSSSLRSRVTEIATCPICLDDFKDARSLPCLHSFCLQCLQGHCKDKCLGDDVACPMCRKVCRISQDGLQALPHNFFLQNLVDAKTTKDQTGTSFCEPCSRMGRIKTASVCCVDCNQKLCDRCSVPHKNWRGGPHDVRAMGDELSTELVWLRGSYCDKHPDRRLELYCFDCRGNICMECCVVSHKHHKCDKTQKVAVDFVTTIRADIEAFPSRISQLREAVKQVETASERFVENVKNIQLEMLEKGNEMKRLVDDHVSKLMKELDEVKTSSVKETTARVDEFELALAALESFHAYCSALASKGSPCDITRAANDLHLRADELLKAYATYTVYRPPNVAFVPASVETTTGDKNNIVGSLMLQSHVEKAESLAAALKKRLSRGAKKRSRSADRVPMCTTVTSQQEETVLKSPSAAGHSDVDPQVIHTFAAAEFVWGVTLLNNELYVLREKDAIQVDVYSATNFTALRHLSVKALSRKVQDITSCVQNQCIYIADSGNTCVHRVGLDRSKSKWPVREKPEGLSVIRCSFNLLVTCCEVHGRNGKLVELSCKDGKPIREITLQSDIKFPWHSVQLVNGQCVVCHGTGMSLVDSDGRVVRSTSEDVGLHLSRHVAVDDDEFIFIADCGNKRIVLFDSSLNHVRNVLEDMRYQPWRLCFDAATRRLYVGQGVGVVSVVQL